MPPADATAPLPALTAAAPEADARPGKKTKKAKAAIAMGNVHVGRLAALNLTGSSDQDMTLTFHLKGKKNKGLVFTQNAAQPQRLTAMVQLLAAAAASRAKLHVTAEKTATDNQTITVLALHLG